MKPFCVVSSQGECVDLCNDACSYSQPSPCSVECFAWVKSDSGYSVDRGSRGRQGRGEGCWRGEGVCGDITRELAKQSFLVLILLEGPLASIDFITFSDPDLHSRSEYEQEEKLCFCC